MNEPAPGGLELTYTGYGAETVLERDGCFLHYWLRDEAGPDAPLILFIHGAGVDHRMWAGQIEAFAARYRILTLDLRGHGRSRPATGYSFGALVGDAFALLDRVRADRAVLIGLSMGGNLAQEMVFRAPDRFAAMVCADCTCSTLIPFFDRFLAPLYGAMFGPLLALYSRDALIRQAGRSSAFTEAGQRYVSAATAQLSKSEIARVMRTLLFALHHEPGYTVPIPQLFCHGAQDKLGNIRAVTPKWRRRDPKAELVVIPDAGHCANIDNPAFFNRTVLDWLARALG